MAIHLYFRPLALFSLNYPLSKPLAVQSLVEQNLLTPSQNTEEKFAVFSNFYDVIFVLLFSFKTREKEVFG